MKSRLPLLLTLGVLLLAGSLLVVGRDRAEEGLASARQQIGLESASEPEHSPIYLSELPWEWATTGWVALADNNLPKLDASFLNRMIAIGDRSYEKGIGTFPLSEIVYSLEGKYSLFQAEVGVDAAVPRGRGSVIFKLFLDDALAYDSGILQAGDGPRPVELSVAGAGRMKLVVEDAGDGSSLDYADWANARLTPAANPGRLPDQLRSALEASREERRRGREADWAAVRQRSERELAVVSEVMQAQGVVWPSRGQANAVFDSDRSQIVIANNRLAITLGYGGERHGLLNVLDLDTRTLVAFDVTASLASDDMSTVALSRHTAPEQEGGYWFQRVEDSTLGAGVEVSALFLVPGVDAVIVPRITLFDRGGHFTYQLQLTEVAPDAPVRRFSYFDPDAGGYFVIGEEAGYLTDYSLVRRAEVPDDSVLRRELVGLGKPVVLYDRQQRSGLLMAVIDQVADPEQFSVRLETGRIAGQVGFHHLVPKDVRASLIQTSPRLFLQVTPRAGVERTTDRFRRIMSGLYPQPPLPDWVKYQWGTWYAFGMEYDEETLREHIDYIDKNLSDLGPWSILLDAGWYVAEGRPGSGWEVDEEKFPNGLRDLVDYAHSKDIRVVLYFSAPYLDDREREGNWLGLRGFIEQHPDWVIPLQADSTGASFVYDFTNPQLVAYMRQLISDFFNVYDVDGIKIDGLGQAEGEQLSVEERDIFGDVNKIRMFTMDIYRLVYEEATRAKKDVYIESGWAIPNYANQYAHTFRYGDEFPAFENPYPQGGLLEHIDYATIQKTVLGQRPNMGMVWGGPEAERMVRLWFEAALAMGTQMTMSIDLTRLSNRDLSALRSVLVHYNAFQGETRFVGTPFARSFATTANGITYLGAVNRGQEPRDVTFSLSDYGLDDQKDYLVYDVSSNRYGRARGTFSARLEDDSFRLFLLRDEPGVVWTNSSFQTESSSQGLKIRVDGPRRIAGFSQIYTPSPSRVWLDGQELPRSSTLSPGSNYSYDQRTGVLRVRYRHDRPHTIEVEY